MTVHLPPPASAQHLLTFSDTLLRELAAGRSPRELAEHLCRFAQQISPGHIASMLRLGEDGLLHVFAAPSAPAELLAAIDGLKPGPHAGSCGNVVQQRQPVFVDDIRGDARWDDLRAIANQWDLQSCWSYPVSLDGKLVGTFALTGTTSRSATENERQLLDYAATIASTLLTFDRLAAERDRHARALDRARRFANVLAKVSHEVGETREQGLLIECICNALVEDAGVTTAWVGAVNRQGKLSVLTCKGRCDQLPPFVEAINAGHFGQACPVALAMQTRHAVFVQSLQTPRQNPADMEPAPSGLTGAAAAIPIDGVDGQFIVLSVLHAESGIFDEELRSLLNQIGQELRRGLERLSAARQRQSERALRDAMVDNNLAGMAVVEQGVLRALNLRFSQLLGHGDKRDAMGQTTEAMLSQLDVIDASKDDILRQLQNHDLVEFEARRGTDAAAVWIRLSARRVQSPGADAEWVWSAIDVTQERRIRERLRWQATHDDLTGLPNRYALDERLHDLMDVTPSRLKPLAVVWIDLNAFGAVVQRYGREAGDDALREIADRLRHALTAADFLARPGGDEFVLLLPLDGNAAEAELESRLSALRDSLGQPLRALPDQTAVSACMGVAIFPDDAGSVGEVLRCAESALHSCKMHRAQRDQWWLRWGDDVAAETRDMTTLRVPEAYGPRARELLQTIHERLLPMAEVFVTSFYAGLAGDARNAAVLSRLTAEEFTRLKSHQVAHFRQLLSPDLDAVDQRRQAQRIGRVHACVGVSAAALTKAFFSYGHLVTETVNDLPLNALHRVHLHDILAQRISEDLQQQIDAGDEVVQIYRQWPAKALADLDRYVLWPDFVEHIGQCLEQLPAIKGVSVARPGEDGRFIFEYVSASLRPFLDISVSLSDRGTFSRTWLDGRVHTTVNYTEDPRVTRWHEVARKTGVRSNAALPVLDENRRPVAVVSVFGEYPGQFEAQAFGPWLDAVVQIFHQAWVRFEAGRVAAPLSGERMERMRELIAAGQIAMYFQPIIDLRSGDCSKFEALARLRDGNVLISPAEFLPACGVIELTQLFIQGLQQTLSQLRLWERQGLVLNASLNLPPSVLREARLPAMLADALAESQVAAGRLTLELLETEQWAGDERVERNLASVKQIGVQIAMDDLGSGYSSLLRLRQLNFDLVKIDQGLVRDVQHQPEMVRAIVGGLSDLMHRVGISVVVEGLETEELIRLATELGADGGQGYAIARPMPAAEVVPWIQQLRRTLAGREHPAG